MTAPCRDECQLAQDAQHIKESLETVADIVGRLDHGINGVNGSIGLVDRVKRIEGVVEKNAPIWSKMRGLGSNLTIIIRTLVMAAFMALGGYLWAIILGAPV